MEGYVECRGKDICYRVRVNTSEYQIMVMGNWLVWLLGVIENCPF